VKIWNVPDLTLTQTLHGTDCIIYSCTWSPDSKKIAASTIAGELLIFDAESSRVMVKYKYHTKASYAVAWNQFDASLLLSTSADNTAVVIEVCMEEIEDLSSQSNQRIGSRRNHKTAKKSGDYAMPKSMIAYRHPSPVFGCAWAVHSSVSKYFATGCQDSIVRIFKYQYPSDGNCIYAFCGHTARSFSVAWSPLIPGLLASGSDDKKVLVWEIDLPKVEGSPKKVNFMRQLVGHKSNVRALSWNHEHRQILISGSWDATMRIWNVVSATCLQVIFDHVADIYTVTSHPARPFCYVSCSRDSTLRVWEIEGLILRLRYKAVLAGSLDSIIGEAPGGGPPALSWGRDSLEPVIYGRCSQQLNRAFNVEMSAEKGGPRLLSKGLVSSTDPVDNLALAEMYRNFYNYFSGSNGSNNFWDCVVAACKQRVDPSNKHLSAQYAKMNALSIAGTSEAFPESVLIGIAKSSARQLEQVKTTARRGDISGKAEEQLRQAAMLFAQTGDFVKYCSIMVEIGDWMAALAMAPCVSHDYWLHLMKGHSQHLKNKLSEDCVPYLIGTGQDREAVNFYLKRKDSLSAMIVSKMSESRTDVIPNLTVPKREGGGGEKEVNVSAEAMAYASWEGDVETECRDRTETEEEEGRRMVRQVALQLVEANVSLAKPICAAAHLVAVNDWEAAVHLLLLCGGMWVGAAIQGLILNIPPLTILFICGVRCVYV
jgi:WD40 repeat protein